MELKVAVLGWEVMANGWLSVNAASLKEGEEQREVKLEPAQALDEVEPLPEDCYTGPVNLPEGKTSKPTRPPPITHWLCCTASIPGAGGFPRLTIKPEALHIHTR